MKILAVRNVHEALPLALDTLRSYGIQRDSRNGPVLQYPYPVATVYERPLERVLFWPERDANPFFHLYESMWMLAGRQDVAPLIKYAKQMKEYSDDGIRLRGAYGFRWRKQFGFDQLSPIINALKRNQDDRRQALQIYDAKLDCGVNSKDIPCNLTATFQRDATGNLHLVVFCRSNDILWGAYGANAVHFSFLLEYMAHQIGCPAGTYTQISVNWHGYVNTLEQVKYLRPKMDKAGYTENPYDKINYVPMTGDLDGEIRYLLQEVDMNFVGGNTSDEYFFHMAWTVLYCHQLYREREAPHKYIDPFHILKNERQCDWVVAATEWIERRYTKWQHQQGLLSGELSHP